MAERIINLEGQQPIYIERNEGKIYVGNHYTEDPVSAFSNGSYELLDYTPTIDPAIHRDEVDMILEWIEKLSDKGDSDRLALLYGTAGIGKSIVMHDILKHFMSRTEYLVLGLKSDQMEFVDTDDLSSKMHLDRPIECVIKNVAPRYKRVVILIDQIDALSLSLSSNRTPLRSLLKVLGQLRTIPNVRIIISCRPYDLEYDPLLDNLNIRNKWELKELSRDKVQQTLQENHCNERLSDRLLLFLGNPLHLYLFLKVRSYEQLTDPLSTDLLYHQLWRKYVNDDSIRKVSKESLLSLLDELVTKMYQRQELSVHIREFETVYNAELRYLLTNGLLTITKNGQVQFFHQTLFDYVYARRFTEKGGDLLEVLRSQHQGLFIRSSVKSILTFLREQDPSEYIQIMQQLLFAKSEDGKPVYRYHIQSLALSTMVYFEKPLPQEVNIILKKIFAYNTFMGVIFESAHNVDWFNAVWSVIESNGGWNNLSDDYKEKTMIMCRQTIQSDGEIVLDKLDAVLDFKNETDCRYMDSILQRYNLNCNNTKLVLLYKKVTKNKKQIEYTNLLANILVDNPDFVCNELKENVRQQLLADEGGGFRRLKINHDVERLYERLLKTHKAIALQLLADILKCVYDATCFKIDGSDIQMSTEFISFQRNTSGHIGSNVVEDITNILIDEFLRNAQCEQTRHFLKEFAQSNHEGIVFIALYVYTSRPNLFTDDVYEIITQRDVLANAPAWVEYQAVEALKMAFPHMDDRQKIDVLNTILSINDTHEKTCRIGGAYHARIQYGHPILDIDLHKGSALEVIPLSELRRLSWTAYQERQRIDRKFKSQRLENNIPCSTTTHIGWTSLRKEQGTKMSLKTWLNSMLKYNTNGSMDWERPTMNGQCQLFRSVVSNEPDKFIGFINQILTDDRIPLCYPLSGMQGLLDAGKLSEAMSVLDGILNVVNNDVNSTYRGFSIHSLLFSLGEIVKNDVVPEIVIRLLCNTLINAEEPADDAHQNDKDIYNVGINQARGNAGYMLVKCASDERYKDIVFSTIEKVATSASVYTRAAILLNMAVLNNADKYRNVSLFKKLMHDYNPRLMAMPVHNYNPLVYFVNYALDELITFFQRASECPECYSQQVIILWLAWSHNSRDQRVKLLLDKMCDTSEEARIALLTFLIGLDCVDEDAVSYILHFMEPQYDSARMGEAFDYLFHQISRWPDEIQVRITDTYLRSPMCRHQIRAFFEFLGGSAVHDPIQTLQWLEQILAVNTPEDYFVWNEVVEVVIQAYNGIKLFNDRCNQEILEHAMDLIDSIMQNPSNKYLISNFINKLDNE